MKASTSHRTAARFARADYPIERLPSILEVLCMSTVERQTHQPLRWDVITIWVFVLGAAGLTVVLDTGFVAHWLASNTATIVDEAAILILFLLGGLGVISMRRWFELSHRLIHLDTAKASDEPDGKGVHIVRLRHELIGLGTILVVAAVLVAQLDTGHIARWLARQSHTRVDEAIVSTFILVIGLGVLSIRRWRDLARELAVSERLRRATIALNSEIRHVTELSDLLQACRSTDEAHRLVAERAALLLPGSSGVVYTIDENNRAGTVATWGVPASRSDAFDASECWAFRRGQEHVMVDRSGVLRCAHIDNGVSGRALCMPMVAQSETVGLLHVESPATVTAQTPVGALWTDAERRLVKTLADQGAVAFTNLALREHLRLQSFRDPLTGLYNRRYLDDVLPQQLARARLEGSRLSVLMIDVDHFKRLNDTHGHDAGDSALRALAAMFRSQFRGDDICCRFGGEEFVVSLPGSTVESAKHRAEQLRVSAEAVTISLRESTVRLSVSIGVATFPDHGENVDDLLRAADKGLYQAKAAGRARVVVA